MEMRYILLDNIWNFIEMANNYHEIAQTKRYILPKENEYTEKHLKGIFNDNEHYLTLFNVKKEEVNENTICLQSLDKVNYIKLSFNEHLLIKETKDGYVIYEFKVKHFPEEYLIQENTNTQPFINFYSLNTHYHPIRSTLDENVSLYIDSDNPNEAVLKITTYHYKHTKEDFDYIIDYVKKYLAYKFNAQADMFVTIPSTQPIWEGGMGNIKKKRYRVSFIIPKGKQQEEIVSALEVESILKEAIAKKYSSIDLSDTKMYYLYDKYENEDERMEHYLNFYFKDKEGNVKYLEKLSIDSEFVFYDNNSWHSKKIKELNGKKFLL